MLHPFFLIIFALSLSLAGARDIDFTLTPATPGPGDSSILTITPNFPIPCHLTRAEFTRDG